ncbi:hypothetical protein VTN96DRAFT_3214 [Rasamsonia emersonii]
MLNARALHQLPKSSRHPPVPVTSAPFWITHFPETPQKELWHDRYSAPNIGVMTISTGWIYRRNLEFDA